MASKVSVTKVIDDLEKVINTWGENPDFSLPDDTTRQQLEELRSEIISDNEEIKSNQKKKLKA